MKFIIKYLIQLSIIFTFTNTLLIRYILFNSKSLQLYFIIQKRWKLESFSLMFHRSRERISSNSSLCTTSRIKKKACTIPIHRPSSMKFTPPPLLKIIAIINHNDEFHRVRATEFLCFPSWNLVPLSLICKCIPPVRY